LDIREKFEDFKKNSEEEYTFPPLNNNLRKEIHVIAKEFGFISFSVGEGSQRRVTISKNSKRELVSDFPVYVTKRFVKDFSFPLPLPFKPYLQYYIDTFDDILDIKSKMIYLKEIYEECSSKNQDLKTFIYSIKDEM
jgi:hypothetical protein